VNEINFLLKSRCYPHQEYPGHSQSVQIAMIESEGATVKVACLGGFNWTPTAIAVSLGATRYPMTVTPALIPALTSSPKVALHA
jgi:hypothetical protein